MDCGPSNLEPQETRPSVSVFLQIFYHREVTNAVLISAHQKGYQRQVQGYGSNPGLTWHLFVFNISKLSKNSQLKIEERLSEM